MRRSTARTRGSIPNRSIPSMAPSWPTSTTTARTAPGPDPGPVRPDSPNAVLVRFHVQDAGAAARPTPTNDRAVRRAAADATALHAEGSPIDLKEAGRAAARVGDEVITLNELTTAVKERMAGLPNGYKPNKQEIMMLT